MANWETVIGLEIHAQLATKSKIFSGASTAFGAQPNTQACAVDLGLPGVLPVLNAEVVNMAIKFGVAVDAEIAPISVFARKNYFYPDLPKGYQISQFELPIVGRGQLSISLEEGVSKIIGITRAHLEEDAGKSLHDEFPDQTGIDLNRAGTPLLEIVSEPDMRSAKEAVAYARKIHALVQYLEICDGNMQEGSFRCDANVSIRPAGQEELGTRTELKNINSFRFLERAINYEIERQIDLIDILEGDAITDNGQETWNLLAERRIENVILCGVHLNMCVLGRPFGIRQMVKQGKNVALVRDMTDTMYNPQRPPGADHFTGTDLVVAHVEKYWCPSFTSADLTGGKSFRFAEDSRGEKTPSQ